MFVQVVENRAVIEGTVSSVAPNTDLPGYVVAAIRVEHVSPVEGYPNLFSWASGAEVSINVPQDKAASLSPGIKVRLRVRKGGPVNSFGDPDTIERL
jgi:hypothetical protein